MRMAGPLGGPAIVVSVGREPFERSKLVAHRAAVLDDAGQRLGGLPAVTFGVVAVAIMEQQHRPRTDAAAHAVTDDAGAGAVRIPDTECPPEYPVPYLVSTRRKYGLRYPCGARKHVGMAPVVVSIASWAAPTSHAVRAGLASARRLCVWVWLPISKPEHATSRPSSGYRSTCRPTMKKVAGTCSRWRSRTIGSVV